MRVCVTALFVACPFLLVLGDRYMFGFGLADGMLDGEPIDGFGGVAFVSEMSERVLQLPPMLRFTCVGVCFNRNGQPDWREQAFLQWMLSSETAESCNTKPVF